MKRPALAALLLALPVAAFALDFRHGDDGYVDADRLSVAERAAVSVLTDIGAVSGNPDGSFAADRTLNRAEFTKIALLGAEVSVTDADASACFPDVPADAWFSRYVCRAKADGVIEGNPDGLFHPERAVNYAEATKILVELFDYDLPEPPENERWAWYRAYILAAEENGVALPSSTDPAHELTRGQMARLAAAFVAEEAGELEVYRRAERGQFGEVSSSSSLSSSSSSSSSSSIVSSSSSSSSSSRSSQSSPSAALFPARDSFLVAGTRTPLILGGTVVSPDETSALRIVRLALRREIVSIDNVYLVDGDGDVIAELTPSTNDNAEDRKWEAIVPDSTFTFPANEPVTVGIRFDLFPKDAGGGSNQLVEIESFTMQSEGVATGNSKFLLLDNQVYPVHQTAFGRLTNAKSVLPASGTLQEGEQRQIASVLFGAETATGGAVFVEGMEFLLSTTNVTVSNIRAGDASSGELASCGIERLGVSRIVCGSMHEGHSWVPGEGLLVSVYADVELLEDGSGRLAVSVEDRGRIGDAGSFRWSDDSGTFNWIEEGVPFGGDVSWTVTP